MQILYKNFIIVLGVLIFASCSGGEGNAENPDLGASASNNLAGTWDLVATITQTTCPQVRIGDTESMWLDARQTICSSGASELDEFKCKITNQKIEIRIVDTLDDGRGCHLTINEGIELSESKGGLKGSFDQKVTLAGTCSSELKSWDGCYVSGTMRGTKSNSSSSADSPSTSGIEPPEDTDKDGVEDFYDNCPLKSNPDQEDLDYDMEGDLCDSDIDGDQLPNESDSCPEIYTFDLSSWYDPTDPDAVCYIDSDKDGIKNEVDNCPVISNSNQIDKDNDGLGDECESDWDDDAIIDDNDNCPYDYNPDQRDRDGDKIGDTCDRN